VQADERGGDGQTEPGLPPLLLGGEERVAQACEMLRRNPNTFVSYFRHHTVLGGVAGGGHGAPALPVGQSLEGVGQEIDHDLLHVLRIAPQRWRADDAPEYSRSPGHLPCATTDGAASGSAGLDDAGSTAHNPHSHGEMKTSTGRVGGRLVQPRIVWWLHPSSSVSSVVYARHTNSQSL
jgi:hypothetical protein